MRKKLVPPLDPKNRRKWDETRHWERTFAKMERTHSIIPEMIQHWRPVLLYTFRKEGQTATERIQNEFAGFFRGAAKEGSMTQEEAKGAIENLNSFVRALKESKKRKLYAKLKVLKNRQQ